MHISIDIDVSLCIDELSVTDLSFLQFGQDFPQQWKHSEAFIYLYIIR